MKAPTYVESNIGLEKDRERYLFPIIRIEPLNCTMTDLKEFREEKANPSYPGTKTFFHKSVDP